MKPSIHLNDGSSEPSPPARFVVAQNGLFLRKQSDWVDALVPANGVDGLKPATPYANLLLPNLKSTVFAKAVQFFYEVYQQQHTEAAVLLHYSSKHGWDLTVPDQEANPVYVKYDASNRLPGYRCVGTMHSHCDMSAFHSGTDTHDEAAQDGVHITIGRLGNYPNFGMDAELVVGGMRFPLPHERITYARLAPLPKPKLLSGIFGSGKRDQLYTIPFGILREWEVPEEWMRRVKVKRELFGFGDFFQGRETDGEDGWLLGEPSLHPDIARLQEEGGR